MLAFMEAPRGTTSHRTPHRLIVRADASPEAEAPARSEVDRRSGPNGQGLNSNMNRRHMGLRSIKRHQGREDARGWARQPPRASPDLNTGRQTTAGLSCHRGGEPPTPRGILLRPRQCYDADTRESASHHATTSAP